MVDQIGRQSRPGPPKSEAMLILCVADGASGTSKENVGSHMANHLLAKIVPLTTGGCQRSINPRQASGIKTKIKVSAIASGKAYLNIERVDFLQKNAQ